MRIGDVDGKGEIYNNKGKLLLNNDENILLQFLPNAHIIHYFVRELQKFDNNIDLECYARISIPSKHLIKYHESKKWEKRLTELYEHHFCNFKQYETSFPSKIFINKRLSFFLSSS